MVHDHFQQRLPQSPIIPWRVPSDPVYPEWTLERWNEYQELLRKAKEYDARTGQPDCPDPKKEKRYREIQKMIEKRYGLKPVDGTKGQ